MAFAVDFLDEANWKEAARPSHREIPQKKLAKISKAKLPLFNPIRS